MSSLFPLYCTPVVSRLMNMMVNGIDEDDVWLEKAVKSLAKKLRKSRQLEEFENILHSKDPLSKCITIIRSLDGRLQIAHRKVLPHVAYCRLFRWPDLHSYHELKALGNCNFSFQKKKDLLCINPYHYYRAEILIMPPIYVPKQGREGIAKNRKSDYYQAVDKCSTKNESSYIGCDSKNVMSTSENPHRIIYNKIINNPLVYSQINSMATEYSSQTGIYSLPFNNCLFQKNPIPFYYPVMAPSGFLCEHPCVIENQCLPFQNSNGKRDSLQKYQNFSNLNSHIHEREPNDENGKYNSQESAEISQENTVTTDQPLIDKIVTASILPAMKRLCIDEIESNFSVKDEYEVINYQHPKYWCTISYYELDKKIFANFKSNSKTIHVDFSTNVRTPECLGLELISSKSRHSEVDECRKLIGGGVKLVHSGGEVILECLSKNIPIFILSQNYNLKNGKDQDYVHVLHYGDSVTIFDYHDFAPLLSNCISHSYEAVYNLLNWTVIRFSFQKGWGKNFRRQTPSNTPIWLEIQLVGPMSWLDRILRQLVSPASKCSSLT